MQEVRQTSTPVEVRVEHRRPSSLSSLSLGGESPDVDTTTRGNSPGVSVLDESVIGQISQELEECEQSLDDRLMQEMASNVRLKRHHFIEELEQLRERSRVRYEEERVARERDMEIERARRQVEEMQQ